MLLIVTLFVLAGIIGSNALKNLTSSRELLRGKNFLVGAIQFAPYLSYANVSANGKVYDPKGVGHDIIQHLAETYQFNFEYIQPRDEVFGAVVNGSWNGLIGMMHRKELDFAAALIITYQRSQVIDLSVAYTEDPVGLLIPYPKVDSITIHGIIRPFNYQASEMKYSTAAKKCLTVRKVLKTSAESRKMKHFSPVWIYIGIAIFTLTIFLRTILSAKLCRPMIESDEGNFAFFEILWALLHLEKIVDARVFNRTSKTPVYLVLFSWGLAVIVLINSYSSTITAYMMAPRFIPMINTIEDIANIPRPICMVLKQAVFEYILMNAAKDSPKSIALSKIGDWLRKYPELRLSQKNVEEDVADFIVQYQRVFTRVKSNLLDIMERDLKKTGECRLYIAKEPWDKSWMGLGLQKSSPLTQTFSTEIIRLRDVGILYHLQRRNSPRENRCTKPLITKIDNNTKLSLNYFLSAFVFLACGLLSSLLAFIIEFIFAKILF